MTAIFPKLLSIVVVGSCLLAACVGSDGPQPPEILSMYGDFEYAEHDTTWLQQLPLTTIETTLIFTEEDINEMGFQGVQAFYPINDEKWIIHAYNTGVYLVERFEGSWSAARIGAVGQGPGEYPNNLLIATMIADSALWLNVAGMRQLKFDLSGQYISELMLRTGSGGLMGSGYLHVQGNLNIMPSQEDSMIVKFISMLDVEAGNDSFHQCIPRPKKQTSVGNGVYEESGYSINDKGEGVAYLIRYPFLIRFQVDESGDCQLRHIISIDPSNNDGSPVVRVSSPLTGQLVWLSLPLIYSAKPLGDCWIIGTTAMASREYFQLCTDGTMGRVQLLGHNKQPRGMSLLNNYNGEIFANYYEDGTWYYVKLVESE